MLCLRFFRCTTFHIIINKTSYWLCCHLHKCILCRNLHKLDHIVEYILNNARKKLAIFWKNNKQMKSITSKITFRLNKESVTYHLTFSATRFPLYTLFLLCFYFLFNQFRRLFLITHVWWIFYGFLCIETLDISLFVLCITHNLNMFIDEQISYVHLCRYSW